MNFKRSNTLAVDFGVLPLRPGPASIQKFLEVKLQLEMAKFRSVQIHSTRAIAYVGLPEELPAAAIAERHHLQHEMRHDGKLYRIPVQLADDDAVDVRVYDLPPEIPTDVIATEFRQYGEVLAIREEEWRSFFPGIKSGVRVLRMRVSNAIPKHITITNTTHTAHVRYPGQPRKVTAATRRNKSAAPVPEDSEANSSPTPTTPTSAAEQKTVPPVKLIQSASGSKPTASKRRRITNGPGGFPTCRQKKKRKKQHNSSRAIVGLIRLG